jgi:hypothetical protein
MKWIKSDVALKMAQTWLVSLIVFAVPHPITGRIWDPIMHRPSFLIIAPLLMACIPLIHSMTRQSK